MKRQRRMEIFQTNTVPPVMVAEFVSYDDKGNKKISHGRNDVYKGGENVIWARDWLLYAQLPDGRIVTQAQ